MTDDLLAEYRALADFCATLTPEDWRRPSAFYGWTAWDEVAHLCFFDETALQAVTDAPRFEREAERLNARMDAGEAMSAIARQTYSRGGRTLAPAELLQHWRHCHEALVAALAPLDPKARLPWYGPTMSARSFATARLMETWAHGQDIWDLMRRRRPGSARLKHIAHLGVTTFGWSFANRGLPVPEVPFRVELLAPDGQTWSWGEATATHRLSGTAEDFCLVVTQRRHVADTGLQPTPGPMAAWMAIAQAFAGEPADGPAPGVRAVDVA